MKCSDADVKRPSSRTIVDESNVSDMYEKGWTPSEPGESAKEECARIEGVCEGAAPCREEHIWLTRGRGRAASVSAREIRPTERIGRRPRAQGYLTEVKVVRGVTCAVVFEQM